MRGGELDVVVMRGNVVVVCEVKARATAAYGSPLESVTERKVRRVQRAGHAFLREWKTTTGDTGLHLRFDVATVLGTALEVHEDIF